MTSRKSALLLLPLTLLLGGCPLQNMVSSLNQMSLTPEIGTYRHLDCDGDGKLNYGEATARIFLRTATTPALHQVTNAEFQGADRDGDWRWSYEEFSAALSGATAWSVSPGGCGPAAPR